ncbi:uncharacterized protein Z518_01665 [Rhinocladiella mackenziei CBS 650.93]|uniref:Rhinocladiella mackenziei CBS 650.93 unplaced genomic scaffold supercont1.1, whole genome shotgun sequence n=1 Tax=Rhinocladiella mackenziei CBS 650.93 TaxID=1442369 RepID=A0A0D2J4G7_9EURO|nr:uncharacterized protein Z518_01665 [Rhinocladiella mackenziei CBS 650.93]KIX10581.1 hypothetical protein Z518_01665 [Rhinocladiella mackenziei CBS 650.93]
MYLALVPSVENEWFKAKALDSVTSALSSRNIPRRVEGFCNEANIYLVGIFLFSFKDQGFDPGDQAASGRQSQDIPVILPTTRGPWRDRITQVLLVTALHTCGDMGTEMIPLDRSPPRTVQSLILQIRIPSTLYRQLASQANPDPQDTNKVTCEDPSGSGSYTIDRDDAKDFIDLVSYEPRHCCAYNPDGTEDPDYGWLQADGTCGHNKASVRIQTYEKGYFCMTGEEAAKHARGMLYCSDGNKREYFYGYGRPESSAGKQWVS